MNRRLQISSGGASEVPAGVGSAAALFARQAQRHEEQGRI